VILGDASPGLLSSLWEFVQRYPDPVLFGILILCGVGLPVPEEPFLLMAGAVAVELSPNKGYGPGFGVHLLHLTVVCAAGILIGDLLTFHLGRRIGRRIFHFPGVKRIATRPRRVRAERFFQRYGPWAIFIARFFAGVRLVMYFSAGMSHRVSTLRFLFMDFLGVLVSVPISIYIGFLVYREFADDWAKARERLGPFHALLVAAIGVGLLVWFILTRKRRDADRKEEATGVVED
jgi:membrane protein DedA with SNARE-associated domain